MGSMIKQSIIFSIPLCLSLGRSLEIMEPASARVSLIECKKKCSREWSWDSSGVWPAVGSFISTPVHSELALGGPSPGILSIAVVDILRYSIILKEVCKLALEVRPESLNQARSWKGREKHGSSQSGGQGWWWCGKTAPLHVHVRTTYTKCYFSMGMCALYI